MDGMTWQALLDGAAKVFFTVVSGLLLLALQQGGKWLVEYIKSLAKAHLNARAAGVVADSVDAAVSRVIPKIVAAVADFKITPEEWAGIRAEAVAIAEERLTDLSGFSRTDARKWIQQEVDKGLTQLFTRLAGKNPLLQSLNPYGPGPDDPAT